MIGFIRSSSRRKPGSRAFDWAPVFTGVTAFMWFSIAAPVCAEVFTVFSDAGFPSSTAPNNVIEFPVAGLSSPANDVPAPEGFTSFKTTLPVSVGFEGWGFDTGSTTPLNLTRFQNGELRFWIHSTTGNVEVLIKRDNATAIYQKTLIAAGLWNDATMNGQWTLIRIPLTAANFNPGTDLSSVELPFIFTAISGLAQTFYIDDVRYVTPATPSPQFNVALHNVSDNSTASQIAWSNARAAGSWVRADQYIQLDIDPDTTTWGIQMYTDNTAGDASPKFTGGAGTNAAGLVDLSSATHTLPVAWTIKPTTATISADPSTVPPTVANPPVAAEPNNNGLVNPTVDPNAFQWLYMVDQKTPLFANGEVFAQVKNNLGIHTVQGITLNAADFGPANPPNFIYFEANFSSALAPLTFKTTTLRVEYFTP